LAASGERPFNDDLVPVLNFSAADHFYGTNVIFQQKLEGRLALLVGDRLDQADLSHDYDFFPIVMLGTRYHVGHFEQLGCSWCRGEQQGDESQDHPN
jgi:hypothetical protein